MHSGVEEELRLTCTEGGGEFIWKRTLALGGLPEKCTEGGEKCQKCTEMAPVHQTGPFLQHISISGPALVTEEDLLG